MEYMMVVSSVQRRGCAMGRRLQLLTVDWRDEKMVSMMVFRLELTMEGRTASMWEVAMVETKVKQRVRRTGSDLLLVMVGLMGGMRRWTVKHWDSLTVRQKGSRRVALKEELLDHLMVTNWEWLMEPLTVIGLEHAMVKRRD